MSKYHIAPVPGKSTKEQPWRGDCKISPMDYKVTVALPVLGQYECTKLCIELLRLQTVKPYFIIVDTGSTDAELKKFMRLRDEDVEVHSLRLNGTFHPSEFVANALDLIWSLARIEFIFTCHSDVFARRRDLLEWLLGHMEDSSVVGYEMTERQFSGWEGMVTHTCSMFDVKTCDKVGLGWSLSRLYNCFDIGSMNPNEVVASWPDTEVLPSYIFRHFGIEPKLIGKEENMKRTLDDNFDHCRSLSVSSLYSPEYHKMATGWAIEAKKDAKKELNFGRLNVPISHKPRLVKTI